MRYAYFIVLSLFIASCNCHEYVKCSINSPAVYLTGYTQPEADSIFVKRYRADNTFTTLIDSMAQPLYASGDTVSTGLQIDATYNYDILVSPAGRHYKVSDITKGGNEYEDMRNCCYCKTQPVCFSYLSSCDVNGSTVYLPHTEGPSPDLRVYLVK